VKDLPKIIKPANAICNESLDGKKVRRSSEVKEKSSTRLLELVHTELCGPTKVRSVQGDWYFMILTDDYSRMTCVIFLKEKLEALDKFKTFKTMVENEIDMKIKYLSSDGEVT